MYIEEDEIVQLAAILSLHAERAKSARDDTENTDDSAHTDDSAQSISFFLSCGKHSNTGIHGIFIGSHNHTGLNRGTFHSSSLKYIHIPCSVLAVLMKHRIDLPEMSQKLLQ